MDPNKADQVLDGKPADPDRPINIRYCLTTEANDSSDELKEINIWFINGDKLLYESPSLIGRYVAKPAQGENTLSHSNAQVLESNM